MNDLTLKDDILPILEQNDLSTLVEPLTKEIHLFDCTIAGTSYIEDKTVFTMLKKEDYLVFQRENNKYDNNAILILTEDNIKLGYVPRKDNIIFARLMDAGKLLKGKVIDIQKKKDYFHVEIGIYLIDF
ncbi:HIRAN domain-containing protein [Floccifex sp.]|uniref:HIRAN domain-containing protein n=1 Tax=Floccifex sp. TaxID=2815810 RepID=UPI002A74F2AE|nr:HIRAN domain-containing protein [Floccifex sp.]MDD7280539.1 HIRAN domain-containing protein [Erysipelotrichaceae bacterium]MDY2958155.1 HIRAN domain-containing protein [Floccifex sp.]